MSLSERFNASAFSRWINDKPGRIFRLGAGTFFAVLGIVGIATSHTAWGIAALVWSVFPLSAGIFDLCWISGVLGGPLKGLDIRGYQDTMKR